MPLRDPAWAKPILPVIFRISSRPQPPAWESASGAQFRKDLRHPQKPSSSRWLRRGQRFFRNWALASGKNAGTWGRDEIRDITGTFGIDYSGIKAISGAFSYTGAQSSTNNNNGSTRKDTVRFSAASVVPTGQENVPPHVWQPLVIYLGRPAQV